MEKKTIEALWGESKKGKGKERFQGGGRTASEVRRWGEYYLPEGDVISGSQQRGKREVLGGGFLFRGKKKGGEKTTSYSST